MNITTEIKEKWLNAAAIALLLSATLLLFIPSQIYLNNAFDFSYYYREIVVCLLWVTVPFFLVLGAILGFSSRKHNCHARLTAFFFALGFLLWLQGNVLLWNLGSFNGRDIEWGKLTAMGIIDGGVWAIVLLLSQWKFAFFYKISRRVSYFLLILQLLLTAFYWLRLPDLSDFKKFAIDHKARFIFSANKNVIFLLLDNFESDLFQEVVNEDPGLKQTFSGFTYYRNTLGGFPVTHGEIPLILTGQYYQNREPLRFFLRRAYQSSSSIPRTLKRNGYETDFFPGEWWPNMNLLYLDPQVFSNLKKREFLNRANETAFLYDLALFRSLPVFLKRPIYNDQRFTLKNLIKDSPKPDPLKKKLHGQKTGKKRRGVSKLARLLPRFSSPVPDVSFMINLVAKAEATLPQNVFKFYHMRGIHDPFHMDENLKPAMFAPTRANWKRTARGELKLVDIFLKCLKKLGIFDDALVFVLADHGHPNGNYGRILPPDLAGDPRSTDALDLEKIMPSALPLLLVKDMRAPEKEMAVSDAPVSLGDIAATVFERLGIQGNFPGRSIFAIRENESRPRHFFYFDWNSRSLNYQYMPELSEYAVNGHAWLAPSWEKTGRVWKPVK